MILWCEDTPREYCDPSLVWTPCNEHCVHRGIVRIRYDDDEPWEINEDVSDGFVHWGLESAHEVEAVHG